MTQKDNPLKLINWTLQKLKLFSLQSTCYDNEKIRYILRENTENHIFDKGLPSRLYKNSKFNNKNANSLIRKLGQRHEGALHQRG